MILGGKRNISTTMPQQLFTLPYHSLAVQNPFYPSEKYSGSQLVLFQDSILHLTSSET